MAPPFSESQNKVKAYFVCKDKFSYFSYDELRNFRMTDLYSAYLPNSRTVWEAGEDEYSVVARMIVWYT